VNEDNANWRGAAVAGDGGSGAASASRNASRLGENRAGPSPLLGLFRSLLNRKAGQSTVEMALVAPVILLTMIGVFDVGRMIWTYNLLAEATREGARYAIVHGSLSSAPAGPSPDSPEVTADVRDHALGLLPSDLTVSSSWLDSSNDRGCRVRVESRYQFRLITTLPLNDFSVPLQSTSEMVIAH
jgi:Flp pilus assembly protein TadG